MTKLEVRQLFRSLSDEEQQRLFGEVYRVSRLMLAGQLVLGRVDLRGHALAVVPDRETLRVGFADYDKATLAVARHQLGWPADK